MSDLVGNHIVGFPARQLIFKIDFQNPHYSSSTDVQKSAVALLNAMFLKSSPEKRKVRSC